jgi:Domain of unknown function (DUF4190)
MSDTSQGPGWWLASDGKWYPPEQWTGPGAAGTTPTGPSGAERYPAHDPGGRYGQYPPDATYTQYPHTPLRRANGLAVASLVCAIAGFVFFVPAVLGIVFGFVARSQIRRSGGTQSGDGFAIAGIIIGFAWVVFLAIAFVESATNTNSSGVALEHHLVAVGGHNS